MLLHIIYTHPLVIGDQPPLIYINTTIQRLYIHNILSLYGNYEYSYKCIVNRIGNIYSYWFTINYLVTPYQ